MPQAYDINCTSNVAYSLFPKTHNSIYGDKNEKAQAPIKDSGLLQQFIEVDKMNGEDKKTIKNLIDAFITKTN